MALLKLKLSVLHCRDESSRRGSALGETISKLKSRIDPLYFLDLLSVYHLLDPRDVDGTPPDVGALLGGVDGLDSVIAVCVSSTGLWPCFPWV